MRVLVSGSRRLLSRHTEGATIRQVLADLLPPASVVIEGGARGVDTEARLWARRWRVALETYSADWRNGPRGGPDRNQRMIDEGKPDLVLAFPCSRSRGTWDLIRRAKKAGIETRVIELGDLS